MRLSHWNEWDVPSEYSTVVSYYEIPMWITRLATPLWVAIFISWCEGEQDNGWIYHVTTTFEGGGDGSSFCSLTTGKVFLKIICVIFSKNAGTVNSQFPLPEPNDLKVASQVTFEDMEDAIGSLRRQLESCERKLSKVMNGTSEDLKQPFVGVMYSFLEQSRRELSEQDQALEDCKKR